MGLTGIEKLAQTPVHACGKRNSTKRSTEDTGKTIPKKSEKKAGFIGKTISKCAEKRAAFLEKTIAKRRENEVAFIGKTIAKRY